MHPLPTRGSRLLPAIEISIAIAGDVFWQRVQRKVGSCERQVMEERLIGMVCGVVFQALHDVIGECGRRIVTGICFDGRQLVVVFPKHFGIEEPALILDVVRAIKSILERHPIDVPLARMVRAIAQRLEHIRQ